MKYLDSNKLFDKDKNCSYFCFIGSIDNFYIDSVFLMRRIATIEETRNNFFLVSAIHQSHKYDDF